MHTFLQNSFASFFFWVENFYNQNAQAYRNHTSKLYYQPDPKVAPYIAYASPFKQWIYDEGISGAFVPTSISGSLNLNRGDNGLKIDYTNGRVLLNPSVGTNQNISGSYSFKTFNFYLSNETQEVTLSNQKTYLNSRTGPPELDPIPPYSIVTPCIFVSLISNENEPFAMGGQEQAHINFSLIVYAETLWQLNSTIDIFSNCARKSFPMLSAAMDPLNEWGDIKTGLYPSGYNYQTLKEQYCNPGNLLYIEYVKASRLSDRVEVNPDIFAGVIQFHVTVPRPA